MTMTYDRDDVDEYSQRRYTKTTMAFEEDQSFSCFMACILEIP